jgi:hypothetical protein
LKAVAPDPEIYAWLWSFEGMAWAMVEIRRVRHGAGVFADIKNDHECSSEQAYCAVGGSTYSDSAIWRDLREYGESGVPEEWKAAWRSCLGA